MTDNEIMPAAPASGDKWLSGTRIEAPIDAVLVMEDRAQLTRRAQLTLRAGRNTLACWPLTALAADQTLRCRFGDGPAPEQEPQAKPPRVIDVQLKRRYLVKAARPEREREIRETIDQLADDYLAAYDRLQVAGRRRSDVRRALAGLVGYAADRLRLGSFDKRWPEQIDLLHRLRGGVENDMLGEQNQQDERLEYFERLGQELFAALQPVSDYQAGLICEVWVPQDGSYLLEWEYQVPCALWRPEYTARLEAGEQIEVDWQSCGTVWQASGEDWPGVELSFSTARPTLGAELPLLDDDLLSARPKTDHEKRVIEVSSRDEVIQKTSSAPEEKRSDTPPGLEDGGQARTYKVPQRVDVPSDGRPHRLLFERWKAVAECGLVCLPEKAEFVFLRSLQSNSSNMPLLAGPVALIKNGGYVGRSKIGYVAQGEKFALSWGSEDGLVVLRDVVRRFEETGLRKHKKYDFTVKSYLANYTGEARKLELKERIPISEIEQVEIKLVKGKTSTGFQKDAQGLLAWQIELAPGEQKTIELAFEVGMPAKVIWDG